MDRAVLSQRELARIWVWAYTTPHPLGRAWILLASGAYWSRLGCAEGGACQERCGRVCTTMQAAQDTLGAAILAHLIAHATQDSAAV